MANVINEGEGPKEVVAFLFCFYFESWDLGSWEGYEAEGFFPLSLVIWILGGWGMGRRGFSFGFFSLVFFSFVISYTYPVTCNPTSYGSSATAVGLLCM